ncbi:MAG TPA: sigma-54 dependent transcriptional regulator [Vicinamibacterales bacterium]|nr:sigma-54 dependent transcriptional regulator [Vicinamibacterales bacterium]
MTLVEWHGSAAPPAVLSALRAAGFETARPGDARPIAVVHCTTTGKRLPSPGPGAGDWIWLCQAAPDDGQRMEAIARGAYDVISLQDPRAAEDLVARLGELAVPLPVAPRESTLALKSAAARRVVEQVARVAPTSMPVLFTGETGTGKEVMARLTHAWSPRHAKPFVPINCAAIPNELMEAELFGYARGAFSGAVQRYDGQLMAAEGGTVLLDEIDDTPLETQTKLLRVLDDRVVSRLGENIWHEVDFRLLAATNCDLGPLIEDGRFGADLYERLAIVTVHLAPLRERLEDLPDLAAHFVQRFTREHGRAAGTEIRADALRALAAYPWPGNIRELRNVVYETLVYKRAGHVVLPSDLPRRVLAGGARRGPAPAADRSAVARKIAGGTMNLQREIASLERMAIEEALARTGGNAAQAAHLLGSVGRGMARDPGGTLRAMMRRLSRGDRRVLKRQ